MTTKLNYIVADYQNTYQRVSKIYYIFFGVVKQSNFFFLFILINAAKYNNGDLFF